MKNKELLKQLNSMKTIKADSSFREENRAVLMNHLYGTEKEDRFEFDWSKNIFKALGSQMMSISQPVMIASAILLFLVGGSTASMKASHNTKPGDSLYIAKIAGEKAQKAFTFGEAKKAQLGVSLASKRVIEINQVLADEKEPSQERKTERVEKLLTSLNKEIKVAKESIEKIDNSPLDTEITEELEEVEVFAAAFAKKDEGLVIESEEEEETATSTEEVITEEPGTDPQINLGELEEDQNQVEDNAIDIEALQEKVELTE
jgi:hypothetical protein